MKTEKESYICCYMLAFVWENQQIQARITQNKLEIFVHNILRPMKSEHLPTYMYFEKITPCYSSWDLSVLINNSFGVYGTVKILCVHAA